MCICSDQHSELKMNVLRLRVHAVVATANSGCSKLQPREASNSKQQPAAASSNRQQSSTAAQLQQKPRGSTTWQYPPETSCFTRLLPPPLPG